MFTNNCYYHIYNRGVDKRVVFLDENDKKFFMKRVNDYLFSLKSGQKLVTVIAYCLMDNHFHLLLRQEIDGGVSEFMHRLITSYTRVFNDKNQRSGRLFESTYKRKVVDTDGYLAHIIRYIHLNVLDLLPEDLDIASLLKSLMTYKWSDCNKYMRGVGQMQEIFDDISYEAFLKQEIVLPELDFKLGFGV